VGTVQNRRIDLLPIRVILCETLAFLMGRELPKCDRMLNYDPDHPGCYLAYSWKGDVEFFCHNRFDYSRGWIYLGREPTIADVTHYMCWTYLRATGRESDNAFTYALQSGVPGLFIFNNPELYDAFLFENRNGNLDMATKDQDGYFFSSEGWEIIFKPGMIGIPLRLYEGRK